MNMGATMRNICSYRCRCTGFRNGVKPMVCNKTNATVIERISGSDDTDKWIGKKVALFPDFVAFKGAAQEAIRVRRAPDVPFNDAITM